MEYVIKSKTKKTQVLCYPKETNGLKINPANNSKAQVINVSKIILMDKDLINEYIRIRLDKKFNEIFNKLYILLQDSDASEEGVGILLNEVDKFKQIINIKYTKYLESKMKRELIAKILLIEEELKQKYVEIKYLENLLNINEYSYDENISKGR